MDEDDVIRSLRSVVVPKNRTCKDCGSAPSVGSIPPECGDCGITIYGKGWDCTCEVHCRDLCHHCCACKVPCDDGAACMPTPGARRIFAGERAYQAKPERSEAQPPSSPPEKVG